MSKDAPTIMVVEDETLLLQAITKKLKLSNMDVISCASGQQAIDYLSSLDDMPDAVWLDYYLKDMNGLSFMQTLKNNPSWSAIPVLVVSNSASPDKVSNMLALGARKYILKAEYRLDEIIGMIRSFIDDNTTDGHPGPGGHEPPHMGPSPIALPVPPVTATPPSSASEPKAASAAASTPASDGAAPAEPPATDASVHKEDEEGESAHGQR